MKTTIYRTLHVCIAVLLCTVSTVSAQQIYKVPIVETSVERSIDPNSADQKYDISVRVVELDLITARSSGIEITAPMILARKSLKERELLRFEGVLKALHEASLAKTVYTSAVTVENRSLVEDTTVTNDGECTLKLVSYVNREDISAHLYLNLNRPGLMSSWMFDYRAKLGEVYLWRESASETIHELQPKARWILVRVDRHRDADVAMNTGN